MKKDPCVHSESIKFGPTNEFLQVEFLWKETPVEFKNDKPGRVVWVEGGGDLFTKQGIFFFLFQGFVISNDLVNFISSTLSLEFLISLNVCEDCKQIINKLETNCKQGDGKFWWNYRPEWNQNCGQIESKIGDKL